MQCLAFSSPGKCYAKIFSLDTTKTLTYFPDYSFLRGKLKGKLEGASGLLRYDVVPFSTAATSLSFPRH
jgi:hypothetical protein